MVRPNCSRTLAYSTAMSSAAQLTPTASAEARIRKTVRALRAAPRSTRSAVHRDAAQCHRADAAGGVQGVERGDRDASAATVDDHHVLTGDEHQDVGVRGAQHGGALAGDDQVGSHRDGSRHAEGGDGAPVGQTGKQLRANGVRCAAVDHHRGRHAGQERARAQLAALRPRAPRPVRPGRNRTRRSPRRSPDPVQPRSVAADQMSVGMAGPDRRASPGPAAGVLKRVS